MKMKIKTFMMLGLMTFIASMTFVSCSDSDDSVTNSVRYAVSDSGDMRSLVFQVFLRLQS